MIPRPPTSTLFPYTTLFRSLRPLHALAVDLHPVRRPEVDDPVGRALLAHLGVASRNVRVGELDRKSTRLNSSHVEISYAVFCLKKKKKNHSNTNSYNDFTSY